MGCFFFLNFVPPLPDHNQRRDIRQFYNNYHIYYEQIRLPCQRESGKGFHYAYAQVPLSGVVRHRHVQWMAEHVLHLVTVQHAHPIAPQMRIGPL